jgi:hypothetical protein
VKATEETQESPRDGLYTWLIILALTVGISLWQLLLYFGIGDKGPPSWDFSVVPDVPGQAPYSTDTKAFPGLVPHPVVGQPLVEPQHVREPPRQADFGRTP